MSTEAEFAKLKTNVSNLIDNRGNDRNDLKDLVKEIVANKGVYSKLHEIEGKNKKKRVEVDYSSVDEQKVYDHKKIDGSMYKKMKRIMKEAYSEDLFYKL